MKQILKQVALTCIIISLTSSFTNPAKKKIYKSIKRYQVFTKDGASQLTTDGAPLLTMEEIYNIKGQLTKEIQFDYGEYYDVIEYSYNNLGLLVKKTDFTDIVELIGYNEKGNISNKIKQYPDGDDVTQKYSYNAVGDIKAIQEYLNNQLRSTFDWEYIYDQEGNITMEQKWLRFPKERGKEDLMSHHKSFVYDDNGFVIEEKQHFKSGVIPSSHTFTRNKSGLVLEEAQYYQNKLSYRIKYEYDSKEQQTKRIHFEDEEIKSSTSYTYNENGDLIREVTESENNEYREYTAEYTYW